MRRRASAAPRAVQSSLPISGWVRSRSPRVPSVSRRQERRGRRVGGGRR